MRQYTTCPKLFAAYGKCGHPSVIYASGLSSCTAVPDSALGAVLQLQGRVTCNTPRGKRTIYTSRKKFSCSNCSTVHRCLLQVGEPAPPGPRQTSRVFKAFPATPIHDYMLHQHATAVLDSFCRCTDDYETRGSLTGFSSGGSESKAQDAPRLEHSTPTALPPTYPFIYIYP